MRKAIFIVLILLVSGQLLFSSIEVTTVNGGDIKVELGYGIVLNDSSSINREWRAIHDSSIPVRLIGTPGVDAIYQSKTSYSSSSYMYKSTFSITPTEPLVAIEMRFLLFDIWGNHTENLSATEILDMEAGKQYDFEGQWKIYSENEASEYYSSISYISQVRTKTGKVLSANPESIVMEAQTFSAKFSMEDLNSKE